MAYYNHSNPFYSYPGFAQIPCKHGLNASYGSMGSSQLSHQHHQSHLQGSNQYHHHHAQPRGQVNPMGTNNYYSIQAAAIAARNLYAQSLATAQAQAQAQAEAQAQAQAAQIVSNLSQKNPNILSENIMNELKTKIVRPRSPLQQSSYIDEYRAKSDDEPKQKVQGNTIHFHF